MADRYIRVRLPEDMLRAMERVLSDRPNWTPNDIVEAALEMWLRAPVDRAVDAAIIAGYTRHPADPEADGPLFRLSYEALGHGDEW